tara:strand:- start:524 stop:829 length:306 start_codon:yes stop_codon:yes gene_type:complete
MKQAKKTIKKVTKMVKKFKTKNWLYVAFLAVVVFNLLRTKTTPKVMMVIAVFTALNYAVTKNVTSALGSGAIVATACMYFNHLKEKMEVTMAAAAMENEDE